LIAHQRLQIAKLTRAFYGQRSERSVQLLDQMALAFEELESSATEDAVTLPALPRPIINADHA
jgi:transposase